MTRKKNDNQVDTPEEAAVEIAKVAVKDKNWWKVTIWLLIICITVGSMVFSFFKFGGVEFMDNYFNKSKKEVVK